MGEEKQEVVSGDLLSRALCIAIGVHGHQTDRYGAPYILHPFRVMMGVRTLAEKIVAILHDTVEDGGISLENLRSRGFPEEVVAAVDALSRRVGETWDAYMERVTANPLASRVKIADLEDNMDTRRMPDIGEEEIARLGRYHAAWRTLTGNRGDEAE
jgi:(p)ppGpp synthase/HD superfamily hydrolase